MAKKQHHEEHVDETWLIPYADMLTLLLALFIVMFAMGKVDKAKLQKMSQQFNVIFSGGAGVLTEGTGGSNSSGAVENADVPTTSGEQGATNQKMEQDTMNSIKKTLESEIKDKGYDGKVKVAISDEGLGISIQDAVLFNSGDARVLGDVEPLLLEISKMIKGLDNDIRIIGHTDNVPISTSQFRSNWDLSAIRAINVMNFMVSKGGINSSKTSIQAFADEKPVATNSTDAGRAKNRRVEIVIVRKYAITSNTN